MLSPPRVEGVSLAPVPETQYGQGSKDTLARRRLQQQLKVSVVPVGAHTMRYGPADGQAKAERSTVAVADNTWSGPQLIAEGKSLQTCSKATAASAVKQAMWLMYHEINDTDSLCTTPPLSIDFARGSVDECDGLGPLAPIPLSPSILTVCGRLDGLTPGEGDDPGPLWDNVDLLPDMRSGATLPTIPSA